MSKKIIKIILLLISISILKNTYAFSSADYKYRNLCANFEVANFKEDGTIQQVGCYNNYIDAKNHMQNDSRDGLAIMTKVDGLTKIIDANTALLDLSVNPETLTYFYTNSELTGSAYTYMDTGSLYGGVDGAHIDTSYSNAKNTWTAKVKIGNFTGWIKLSTYEIVPITWIKSSSSYTVSGNDIRHNYVAKIQNYYSGSAGRTIGPKPEMLNVGTYYSYDGHYFYKDLKTLIKDYKNNTYNNSVNNNNPYYNYYMYLSNHTKTTYSSVNIDEYIRNNLGYKKNVYGNAASSGTSRLYGSGTFFYYAQEKYGVNAILSLSLSRNETGNGTSNLSINKNNGFGLNAVDSNPTQAANWYASFASSILGYASKWITYGYAHPRDWRYFGPQFGDKWIGMNVKYASDTYWSEKMAANYYSLDRALGLQDYNFYQLGVTKGAVNAYKDPNTSSKVIYTYPEKEDALVIIGEVNVNNQIWYKVVSDLNIDQNYNEIQSGDYNWNSYVYVEAAKINKINTSKNNYISPNEVTDYEDKYYKYDLLIENTELKPRVGKSIVDTPYYYDSTLSSQTKEVLLKDRYVMVYSIAYKDEIPVAYLVTSDYFHDQKEWVSANSISFVNMNYGKVSVTVSGNQYTWVNYNTEDKAYSKISGLYTNTYVPVLTSLKVGSDTWLKVPVSLTTNSNVYGYTLKEFPGVSITLHESVVTNSYPVIQANNLEIYKDTKIDLKENVTAYDEEDKDLTNKVEIIENTIDLSQKGEYKVTYQVVDSSNQKTIKTIKVIVKEDEYPVIDINDQTTFLNEAYNPLETVTARDKEDGDITNNIKIINNTVNPEEKGIYEVTYQVTDSFGHKVEKKVQVTVKEKEMKEEEGEFNLEELVWDKAKKSFTISGYLIIKNQNNDSNKQYYILLKDKNSEKEYQISIPSWTQDIPYNIGIIQNYNYSNSWFKGEIDFSNIPNGDYDLYMKAISKESYTIQSIDNYFNINISRRGEDDNHGYNFRVEQKSKNKEITLSIRDELYTSIEPPTTRNMVNGYEEITFKNDKLYLYGYSYDYNGTYEDLLSIDRKLILENTTSYKQEVIDLSGTKGPFTIKTKDNKDKTYAWFEKELDISNLEPGNYSLLIYTKTKDATNYDEIYDIFRSIQEEKTISGKKYQITYNKDRGNRIELTVK